MCTPILTTLIFTPYSTLYMCTIGVPHEVCPALPRPRHTLPDSIRVQIMVRIWAVYT